MTAERDFKELIRRYMARSGQSYQAARRSLLANPSEENDMTTQFPYDASAIQGQSAMTLAEIRRHPDRFITDTGAAGIEHLCLELVANSVDEFTAGQATNVAVVIGDDGSIFVRDDGRGIPVEPIDGSSGSPLETAFLEPGASAKRSGRAYPTAAGWNGMGASVVTALSSRVRVWVERDGTRYEAEFSSTSEEPGRIVSPVTAAGTAGLGRSTAVQFWPDPAIFGDTTIDVDRLVERLSLLAAISDGLVISLSTPGASPRVVGSPGQLGHLLGAPSTTTRKVIRDDGRALVAMAASDTSPSVVRSFVNGIETVGGDHVGAALAAAPPGGWAMIVSVWVKHPQFERVDEGGYVARSDSARDLVAAAMQSEDAKAS